MTIRSKHNNLLNYFIHDHQDLSPAYVRSCEKFFKEISSKRQAPSATERPQLKNIIKMKGINNEKEYKEHS